MKRMPWLGPTLVGLFVSFSTPVPGFGAERVVLGEYFNAIW